jgi:oligosaccharide repeat unit polymerase
MSRGDLIFGGILFACGYIISEKKKTTLLEKVGTYRLRRVITAILALILFVVGLEFVRSNRGIVEGYGTTATKLTKLKDVSFITPSVLFYVSGHYGVLNQYFKTQNEKVVVGAYSLAPFWRLISKLGFPVNIKPFQPFYNTPFQGNNGTYLRELHADYGLAGIVAGPYFLGAIASWFWFRARQSQKILDLMILGHILFVVAMSIFLFATQWGSWLVSLLFGMTVAYWIDHFHAIKVDEKIKLIT